MNTKIKKVIALVLFSAASITLLFALPHPHRASPTSRATSASSILLDNTFNAPFFATQVPPSRGVLLPDGKYVLFFNIDTAAHQATGPIIRYNADGSFDNTFSFSRDYGGVSGVAATPDGKLIISAGRTIYGVADPSAHSTSDILRLNADGSIDSNFGPAQTTDGAEVRGISLDPNGNILIAGVFTAVNQIPTHGIMRLLPNGAVDPDFNPVSMTCPSHPFGGDGCGLWADPVVDADGKIIIAGDFIEVNGVSRTCVARLNADGTLDQTFNPSGFTPFGFFSGTPRPIRGVAIQSDGKIVIGGRFRGGNCNNQVPLVRLNTDGSRDDAYIFADCLPPNGISQVRNLVKDANNRIIAVDLSMWRFNTDGSLDGTFHNPVFAFAQQCCYEGFNVAFADGGTRLFVGGYFSDVDDVGGPPNGERWGAAKFNATDGSLDTSFTTSGRVGGKIEPNSFLRHADGFTLISFAGLGTAYYPPISHAFGRLFSTGALDLTFDPIASFNPNGPLGPNFVSTGFTPFSDGSMLVTGQNGVTANYGRLMPDASEDPNFQGDPNVTFANAVPRADGKLVVSQYEPNFNDPNLQLNPNAQAVVDGTEVRRINAAGSLDNTFLLDPTIVADTQVRDGNGHLTNVYVGSSVLALTANNTILFGYLSKDGSYHLVRLSNDGSIDSSFQGQTFPVQINFNVTQVNDPDFGNTFVNMYYPTELPVKQAKNVLDNKVVLMGSFASYGGVIAHGMLRIKPDGSLDPSFSVGDGAQWVVTPETEFRHPSTDNLEVGLNDKLLLTGTFEKFNNTPAPGIINLNPDGTIDPDFVAPVNREIYDFQPAYLKRQPDGSFLLSGPYSTGNGYSPSFFRLLLPPGVDTPPGTDVTVDLGGSGGANDITVNFNTVENAGTTSVALINPEWAGQLPPGYQIAGADLAFEVWTTATYTPPVTVCFVLSSLPPATFAAARILHNDGGGLVDVTSSKDPVTQTICAAVNSLSPFVVVRPTATPSPTPTATFTPTATPTATATATPTATATATATPTPTATPTATATPSPAVTTNPATNVASVSATLNGSVNPRGATTTVYFQWGTTTSYEHTTPVQTQTGNTSRPITANISGLSVSHLYHFRIVATNGGGTSFGSDRTFTTLSAFPVVATNLATNVASVSATLNGSVNPRGSTTTVRFQYGPTTSYGHTTATQTKTGNTSLPITANISGLSASHLYHFRIVATNGGGTTFGPDRIFTTLSATGPPVVTTKPTTNVTTSSARLNGSLDPHGLTTTVYFKWGTTTSYGHTTPMQSQTGNTYRNIAANIGGLARNTTYHFRIVATNSVGTRYGSDRTFQTP